MVYAHDTVATGTHVLSHPGALLKFAEERNGPRKSVAVAKPTVSPCELKRNESMVCPSDLTIADGLLLCMVPTWRHRRGLLPPSVLCKQGDMRDRRLCNQDLCHSHRCCSWLFATQLEISKALEHLQSTTIDLTQLSLHEG